MGAVFALLFLAVIFCITMFFIIISAIFLIIRKFMKRRGKLVKKRWFVIPMVILVFNSIVAFIPVGYIAFLRIVNNSTATEIVYAKSGKSLFWPMDKYEENTNWFEMDGTKYVRFPQALLCPTEDKRGEPVANIRDNHADDNAFNEVMFVILAGNIRDNIDVSTVYPLINENGFELFEVKGSAGGGVYCPESKLDSMKAYYTDIANYDTQNIQYEYSVYSDKKGDGERNGKPYVHIRKDVTIAPGIFEKLNPELYSGKGKARIEIPQQYTELDEAAQPGTSIFGYNERELYAYSKDKMAFQNIYLVLIEGQVYIQQGSQGDYLYGYPLPDELNQYISNTVFVE